MTDINKQRFLPELGKLLTFMCEEDRQTALSMYSRLIDDAEDEQKLMDLLVSPTRQAVVIARTYDAKARKQQLESGSDGEAATPAFMLAIDDLYQQVAPNRDQDFAFPEPSEEDAAHTNQFSLFPDDEHPIDDSEYVPFQIEAETVPIEEPVEALPVEPTPAVEPEIPAEEEAPAAEEETVPEIPAEEEPAAPVVEEIPAEEPSAAEAETAPEFPAEEEPAPFVQEVFAEEPAVLPVDLPVQEELPDVRILPAQEQAAAPEAAYQLDYLPETRRKAKVFLLILYVLFAVPLTLAGLVLLLIPTLLVLALAVGVIAGGAFAIVAAFSGFPKLADLLLVLGAAVIVLALGLLLLWLFVWFIGGAMGGLIRGVIELGRKWCYEEVPV